MFRFDCYYRVGLFRHFLLFLDACKFCLKCNSTLGCGKKRAPREGTRTIDWIGKKCKLIPSHRQKSSFINKPGWSRSQNKTKTSKAYLPLSLTHFSGCFHSIPCSVPCSIPSDTYTTDCVCRCVIYYSHGWLNYFSSVLLRYLFNLSSIFLTLFYAAIFDRILPARVSVLVSVPRRSNHQDTEFRSQNERRRTPERKQWNIYFQDMPNHFIIQGVSLLMFDEFTENKEMP